MKKTALAILSALLVTVAPAMAQDQGAAGAQAPNSADGTLDTTRKVAAIASLATLAIILGDSDKNPIDEIECFDGEDCDKPPIETEEPPVTEPPVTEPPVTTPPVTTTTTTTTTTTGG